ncbi:tyrosine-type recombinase/integrase [Duganella sp. FT135W]|uniref:Tyrosine-type recombinase/integrase n=1 Tax=Duganella flavida TaxID=2692175 RepID=A0A6L8KL72_9BURK|nr:tyrosine-type recombinase/integrase [Duganella flavida]MYM26474.1 tyrosine-type recombinase/integrase [Duganella flavida]
MAYRTIGNTVVEWEDNEPFIFSMSETIGTDDDRRSKIIAIDLSSLRQGFEDNFLLHVKDHFIERSNKVILRTIDTEVSHLKNLFRKVIDLKLFDSKIATIDEGFLMCLGATKEKLPSLSLRVLKRQFAADPYSPLFVKGLHSSDFPLLEPKKGRHGIQIDRILARALSQAAVARILNLCDAAYDTHSMDIGHYSFVHLAFAVFCRPESYRQIRVGDLEMDSGKYFIHIIPAKSGVRQPDKIRYQINEALGVLLKKQRQNIITTYGHLVDEQDIAKLALFPVRRLKANGSIRVNDYASNNYGMYDNAAKFSAGYSEQIKKLFDDDHLTLSANALRHTVGTLLAQTGASAGTIQAVLKHASPIICHAYVDIAFHGLINELSDAMRPAFAEHLPAFERFRSKNDSVPAGKTIRSEDLETGIIEETGECGKDIVCSYAPITCYSCFRFIPCWDADHSLNLNIVQREIEELKKRGKPFEHMVERGRTAKNRIMLVMHAADRYQDAMRKGIRP